MSTTLEERLDRADAAIEEAVAAGDAATLERIASELEAAAAEGGPDARALGIAAARARAAIPQHPGPVAPPPALSLPAAPTQTGETIVYASWGRRVAAYVIDWIVLLIVAIASAWVFPDPAYFFLCFLVFPFTYFATLHALFGRTVGKRLLGMVVRRTNGDRIEAGTAVGRTLIQLILVLTLVGYFVDSLWPLWSARAQALHDKAADTVVIRSSGTPSGADRGRPGSVQEVRSAATSRASWS